MHGRALSRHLSTAPPLSPSRDLLEHHGVSFAYHGQGECADIDDSITASILAGIPAFIAPITAVFTSCADVFKCVLVIPH